MTPATLERIRALPPVLPARLCAGMLFGKPISLALMLEIASDLSFGFAPALLPPHPSECGYCGRPIAVKEKWRTCPSCGGPWDEALVRGWSL